MHGFYRIAAAVPEVRVADISFNEAQVLKLITEANEAGAAAVVFPELCLTGYTCADLFLQPLLIDGTTDSVKRIAEQTAELRIISIIGIPFYCGKDLYNCAVVIQSGKILGIVPKSYNPNYREFYEKRWFKSGRNFDNTQTVDFCGQSVPFGMELIFALNREFSFGIEICEDLWSVIPPSSYHCMSGATITFNLSASNELVSKADYRRELIKQQSARCMSGYVYASSGVHESTTDLVFGGHAMIAENGSILTENERFQRQNELIVGEIDCGRLYSSRITETSFSESVFPQEMEFTTIKLSPINEMQNFARYIDPHPFVPSNPATRSKRCQEIFSIQSAGLAKRIEHAGLKKAVIGVSGGLDSTLALLVTAEALRLIGRSDSDIIAITMPGFGTSDRTYNNAIELCKELKTELREINIKKACLLHFDEIGHDSAVHDVTYENVQARERTQVLMDVANKEHGMVVGTGDLSEIALGWSTYNGDHMSMYAVNASVPKTLIRYVIQWVADHEGGKQAEILKDIIDTPVTPELLPIGDDGAINQKTEEILGPYELHDFFLYHTVKYGSTPERTIMLAKQAFGDKYSEVQIKAVLKRFISRFFTQQFKRSCIPDGPKVGTICLSPRGDWRMPSDASASEWLKAFAEDDQ